MVYVAAVAPEILVKVTLSVEVCHWMVQVPVPPEVALLNVAVPPVQIVAAPDTVMDGSATTVMMTSSVEAVQGALLMVHLKV